MDFVEQALVRLNHWIAHNESHQEEYERFAAQLEAAGKGASALQIREMVALSKKSNECLRKARTALAQ
jgi:primosomal protein N''